MAAGHVSENALYETIMLKIVHAVKCKDHFCISYKMS